MCGLAGLIHCGDPEVLGRMTLAIGHRGPDSDGLEWFSEHGSGFGHCRLAILDLSPTGHQPMATPDGRHWIVFNGEIYNFQELREELRAAGYRFRSTGDTEMVLYAWQEWGVKCLNRFNGMFAFAIFDTLSGQLFAARDHIGIKPFYYWQQGKSLAFASEIKSLLQCPFLERAPDLDALQTPARFQISPRTGFAGIHKLPPGHFFTFGDGKLSLSRYWQIEPREDPVTDERALAERLQVLLKDAVRLQMISDRPVGTFLSGGLDSSIISALMRANTSSDIHAFTIKFSEADQRYERMPDDCRYARQVADRLGFKFHEFELRPAIADLLPKMVWHLDEPLSDPATVNTYLISRAARDMGIIVLLNGVGGDEIFGGYRKHLACLKAEEYQRLLPGPCRRALETGLRHLPVASGHHGFRWLRWLKRFGSFASLPQAERYLASDLSLSIENFEQVFPGRRYRESGFYRAQTPTLNRGGLSYLTRMCLNDTLVFLPEHNLTYSDKASMAAGIETRPPLADYRIVEWMFTLPPSMRIRGNVQKYLLKKASEPYLDASIIHRPKAPFNAPLRAWMRGPLAPMVDEFLSETSLKARGFHDAAFVRTLIRDDRRGAADHAMVIWSLLTFELWFRTFFDKWTGVAPASGDGPARLVEARNPLAGGADLLPPAGSLNAVQKPGTNVK